MNNLSDLVLTRVLSNFQVVLSAHVHRMKPTAVWDEDLITRRNIAPSIHAATSSELGVGLFRRV